jgi:hypothetical protein
VADRICSLCGQSYTDQEGHNYDACVIRCKENLKWLTDHSQRIVYALEDAKRHLQEAQEIQKKDWWKKK